MINPVHFIQALEKSGINLITGVPDSLLKDFCACISDHKGRIKHIIATNEGSAIGLAIGQYLASSNPALVYMQNSGLGNVVNPLVSIADTNICGIPMILLIGWRGEITAKKIQINDEPQHIKQGEITLAQLELMDIPFQVIDGEIKSIDLVVKHAFSEALIRSGPVAIVVRKNTFSKYISHEGHSKRYELTREQVIKEVLNIIPSDTPIVSTTGMTSRELFELRRLTNAGHQFDFLTVGGMGHANQIAAGLAFFKPEKKILCLDGDGALLMHAGSLAISADCQNLVHILINNEAHDSVGGQPTKGGNLKFDEIAHAFGYCHVASVSTVDQLREKLNDIFDMVGSVLIEVRCRKGARSDLGRPDCSPDQNKVDFMKFLGGKNEKPS